MLFKAYLVPVLMNNYKCVVLREVMFGGVVIQGGEAVGILCGNCINAKDSPRPELLTGRGCQGD